MDGSHDIRPGQAQEIGVAPHIARVVAEALTAEVRLGQAVALDERSGGAVQDENALAQQRPEQEQSLLTHPGRPAGRGSAGGRLRALRLFGAIGRR